MNKVYALGHLGDLKMTAGPSALVGFGGLLVVLVLVGLGPLGLQVGEAVLGGVLALILHLASVCIHHFGHALAARSTGYRMVGVHLYLVMGRSIYPADEGELPAAVHIRRALGGPILSGLVALGSGIIVLLMGASSGIGFYLVLFFFLDNLFVFTIGVLLPLWFTDGGTLLYWLRRR